MLDLVLRDPEILLQARNAGQPPDVGQQVQREILKRQAIPDVLPRDDITLDDVLEVLLQKKRFVLVVLSEDDFGESPEPDVLQKKVSDSVRRR